MSTRSRIGLLHEDGTVSTIYCHSDGYFTYLGQMLWDHYRDGKGVKKMIQLGDMSVLGRIIGKKHDFDWRMKVRDADDNIDWDAIEKDPRASYCRFYRRDRGEKGVDAYQGSLEKMPTEEYSYLFDEVEGQWICRDEWIGDEGGAGQWYLLADVIAYIEAKEPGEHGKFVQHGEIEGKLKPVVPRCVAERETADESVREAQESLASF